MGRPTKYNPDQLILVEGWARDGLIDEQIAHNLGIGVSTLNEWKQRYPEFAVAIKKGKDVVDREVENAMLRSAMGFEYTEEAVTNRGTVVTLRRFQPPNVTAQIFWLKNRKPREFRDKQEVEHSTPEGRPLEVSLSRLSDEELGQLEQLVGRATTDERAAVAGFHQGGAGAPASP